MRKLQNRYLLLGCVFGAQLLCATKGYSHGNIDYADSNPKYKTSPRNAHDSEKGEKEKSSGALRKSDKLKDVYFLKKLREITGKVTGPDGKGISGVTVQIKGTNHAVITNQDGDFSISASKADVLVVSNIGFETKEVTVTDDNLTVSLDVTSKELTE